uniref:Uncharacterized protein n=1 Tax=Porodaedalea pini TaxID=108901 RepID=A0A5B9RCU5_9AGAM|nr:hypothetical protein PPIT_000077 [Porodaedalea pini]QEG56960.1 hypothetical protein PPIT_000077 [Porodaedalea pini]
MKVANFILVSTGIISKIASSLSEYLNLNVNNSKYFQYIKVLSNWGCSFIIEFTMNWLVLIFSIWKTYTLINKSCKLLQPCNVWYVWYCSANKLLLASLLVSSSLWFKLACCRSN